MSKPNHRVAHLPAHRGYGHPRAAHHRKASSSSGTQHAQNAPKSQTTQNAPEEPDLDQYIPGAFPSGDPPSVAGLSKISPEHESAFVHCGFNNQENMPTSEHPSGSGVGIGSMPGSNRESGVATLPEERVGGKPYGQGHTGFEPSLIPPNRQKPRQDQGTAPSTMPRGETANYNNLPESQRPMTEPLFPKIQDLPISMDAPAMDFLSHMNPVHYHAPQGVYGTGEDARRAEYLHEINPVHPDALHPGDRMRDDNIPESSIFSATQRKGVQATVPPLPSLFTQNEPRSPHDQTTTQRRLSVSDAAKAAWHNVEGVVESAVLNAEKAWESVNEYMHGHLPPPIGVDTGSTNHPAEGPVSASVSQPEDRSSDSSNVRSPSAPLEHAEETAGTKKPPLRKSTSNIKDSFMTSAKDIPQSIPTHGDTQDLAQKFRDLKVASHPDDLPATVKEEYFKSVLSRPLPESPSPSRSPVAGGAQLAPPPPQHSGRRRRHDEFDLDGERLDISQWLYDSDTSDASAIGDDLTSLGLDWKSDRAREGWSASSDTPACAQQTHAKHILERPGGGSRGSGVHRVPVPAEGQPDTKEGPNAQKPLRQSGLRKAYVSSESVGEETSEGPDDELEVGDGKGVGTGFGGVGYHHGYTHVPASKDQPAMTILPGYPTPEGMKTLIQGRMDGNAARKRAVAEGARDIDDATSNAPIMPTTRPEAMTTAAGLSTLAPVKARAGIPQSSLPETIGQDEEDEIPVGRARAPPHRVPVKEKDERPVFLTGEDPAAGRFEAIFEPATDNTVDTSPDFLDPRSKAAGAAEGKFEARELPKQPTFASTIDDPNVEQLVPVGDLSMAPASFPVPEDSFPLPNNGPMTRTLPVQESDSRDSNATERGSYSDLDLGLDTPTGTPATYPLPTSSIREQSRTPVFRSGASTASGPFEARYETVTGQPKEVDERPVFKSGTAAAEGKYEATMTPIGFPPPPRKSNLKRPSGSERLAATSATTAAAAPNPRPLPPRPHKASVVDASMLPDDDEMPAASAGGDIGLQPNPLAHRSPRELHEVPIFRSGDDTAAGHYEAAFATVSGQAKEVDVEPVFVGSSQGQDSAEGHYEAKMEPEVFHKRRASVSDNKTGLAYLGKPVAPTQELEMPQRAPRRSIN